MAAIKELIDEVTNIGTVRASATAFVRGLVQRIEDASRSAEQGFDGFARLHELVLHLRENEAGLASALVAKTVADDLPAPQIEPVEPVPNPASPMTVGQDVVSTDLQHVADAGMLTFTSSDGTEATFEQTPVEHPHTPPTPLERAEEAGITEHEGADKA